ncbi:MAG: methyltransferase domain-containing protein [Casimicrobiaceae bacterium]
MNKAEALVRWWRRRPIPRPASTGTGPPLVAFQCNLCGAANRVPETALGRELPSCVGCGSTVRWRALVHLVCQALLGREVVIPDSPRSRDLTGIGLSDDACVARALAACFDYTNTYFHADPRLDIAAIPDELAGHYDFLTASDVFEHVVPPVGIAFRNARRLLKPGGVLVFTVPFSLAADTLEHFPSLHDFEVREERGGWVLHNRTADGREERFGDLVFHGGPGTTLEMRLFSRAALERHFAAAGFADVRFAADPCPRFGIVWPEPWSIPVVATA